MIISTSVFFLYADPGAGALLLQMLLAAVFGGMFFFRSVRDRVLGVFGRGPYAKLKNDELTPTKDSEISPK